MREQRGNVAVAMKPMEQDNSQVSPKRRIRPLLKGLTAREKLLYLSSVVVCVGLAIGVISQYAKVTELSVSIQNTENEIQQIKEVNLQLETEKKRLGSVERIRQFAKENGLTFIPNIAP
ncbi:cell division protein FtsL [Risungbinella massiliensis]|uniref:cell division protein FtsL n=1 Tax=Risungbinella massiliensis TaxID=1329796 RepID=UPI0005CC793B|nr:cell division protein FtsL [Risungbinella massiliensis]